MTERGPGTNFLGFDSSAPLLATTVDGPPGVRLTGIGALRLTSLRLKGLVVAQFPNAPVGVWLAAAIFARLTSGRTESIALAIALVALTAWATLELADGANWFRRLLGGGVLAYVIAELADVLPA